MSHKHKHRIHKKKWRRKMSSNPTNPTTVGQAVEQVVSDVQSDITATESAITGTVDPLWQQAVSEYQQLEPAAQGRIHQLLNDIETAYSVTLAGLHGVLQAAKK